MSKTLIIGMGNVFRGDDGAGPRVAEMLRAQCLVGVEVVITRGEGLDLVSLWSGRGSVIVIGAVHSESSPGTLHHLKVSAQPTPLAIFGRCTHSVSLAESVELARILEQLPKELVLYGIEGVDFTLGAAMSEPVVRAIPELVKTIADSISRDGGATSSCDPSHAGAFPLARRSFPHKSPQDP